MLSSVKKASVSGARVSNTQRVFWVDTDSLRTFSLINVLSQAGCECCYFQTPFQALRIKWQTRVTKILPLWKRGKD